MNDHARLLLLPLTAALTGCLGLPFVTPPARVSASYAAFASPLPGGDSSVAHVELGVYPAGLFTGLRPRRLDLGAGYGFLGNKRTAIHAPYLEMQALPLVYTSGESFVLRAGTALKPMLLYGNHGERGFGGSAQVLFEVSTFTSGKFGDINKTGGVVGVGGGELGLGLHVGALALRLQGENDWGAEIGVDLRMPASIGFIWVWLSSLAK